MQHCKNVVSESNFLTMETLKVIRNNQNRDSIHQLLNDFNHQDKIENQHAPGTVKKYSNMENNFLRYCQLCGLESVHDYTLKHLIDFVRWLPENLKSCDRTHISKHVARINKAMDYAVNTGLLPFNPSASYRVKRARNKPVINLDSNEVQKWFSARWENELYRQVQDLYTFQIVCGLSYCDLFTYMVNDNEGQIWIEGVRSKTGRSFWIPLFHPEFKQALDVHQKYGGKLPRLENHFYNRLLKEMARVLGIEKYITSHVGRKTFATVKHRRGWSVNAISSMLGNTEKVCNMHYINFSRHGIESDIKRLA